MSISIKPEQLADTVIEELKKYDSNVQNMLKKEIKSVGRSTAKMLRSSSPKRTGAYAKKWSSKVEFEKSDEVRVSVYNKAPTYRLTHLLEHGHANRDGSHTSGNSHIANAEKHAIQSLNGKVKVGIRQC